MKRGKHARDTRQVPWYHYCPTNKRRYSSAEAANAALDRIHRRPKTAISPTHYYACELCDGWHLTARPQPGAIRYEPLSPVSEALDVVVVEEAVEPPAAPELSDQQVLDWVVAEHLQTACAEYNRRVGRDVTMRIFRPMVLDALQRVREGNKRGDYCTHISDPRHDAETCPTDHPQGAPN